MMDHWEAALQGRTQELAALIHAQRELLDARDADTGFSLLHYAVSRNHRDTVLMLLAEGADRGARTLGGKTALEMARGKGFSDLVTILSVTDTRVSKETVQETRSVSRATLEQESQSTVKWKGIKDVESVAVEQSQPQVSLEFLRGVVMAELMRCSNSDIGVVNGVVSSWSADTCRGFLQRMAERVDQ